MNISSSNKNFDVLVVGGGAGGIGVASMLLKRKASLSVAVIEPSEFHYYQPAWTLVGGGTYSQEKTRKQESEVMPQGATWIKAKASQFEPDAKAVVLEDGSRITYGHLVVAAGLQLNWSKIAGLEETLGKNGVTSNYRYDLAPYTWECIGKLKSGAALFTQPAMPIKCAGAPQKIMYLAADEFRRRGVKAEVSFFSPGGAMFGVPFYSDALDKVVEDYGIHKKFAHSLIAVDGPNRKATFEVVDKGVKTQVAIDFQMLHVVPPQSAPDFIRNSPLADPSGWLAVDKFTLEHTQYPDIYGLGDCTTTPNSKTAAAVKNQVPVVVENLLRAIDGKEPIARYDGYASCPLTTSRGKIMLAEFCYDGVVTPSFPLDPRVPRRSYWWLKKSFLPFLYWKIVVPGRTWPITHKKRDFPAEVPAIAP